MFVRIAWYSTKLATRTDRKVAKCSRIKQTQRPKTLKVHKKEKREDRKRKHERKRENIERKRGRGERERETERKTDRHPNGHPIPSKDKYEPTR